MRTFARALIFNYLVKGSDAHARNYSLLLTASGIRLAPLYDLNATVSFAAGEARTLAMSIGGAFAVDEIGLGQWRLQADLMGVDHDWLVSELASMGERMPSTAASTLASPDLAAWDSPVLTAWLDGVRRSRATSVESQETVSHRKHRVG